MANLESSVVHLKVLNALRAATPEKLNELADVYNLSKVPFLLGLAVETSSSLEIVARLVHLYRESQRDINEQNEHGATALHIAVARNREDVAAFLLEQPDINDALLDDKAQTPLDIVPTPDMAKALQKAQDKYIERTAPTLKAAFESQNIDQLNQIFANPRVQELLDINGINPDTGSTVLHDAAKSNNLQLVQFILTHNGDPLAKNHAGKLPVQVTKNDKIKRLLQDSAKSQAILDQTNAQSQVNQQPFMEGYLKKWTNMTRGYRARWFVLKDGTLNYYKKPEDSANDARGMIDLKSAVVKLSSSEKNRFDIRTPQGKFHLRASHPVETNRWVWALQSSIRVSKDSMPKKRAESVKSTGSGRTSVQSSAVNSRNITVNSKAETRHLGASLLINDLTVPDDEDECEDDEYETESDVATPAVSLESMLAQLAALQQLVETLQSVGSREVAEAAEMGKQNLDVLENDLQVYAKYVQHLLHNLNRSENTQKLWAQNMRELQLEHVRLQKKLSEYEGESEDEFFDTVEPAELEHAKRSFHGDDPFAEGPGETAPVSSDSESRTTEVAAGAAAGTGAALAAESSSHSKNTAVSTGSESKPEGEHEHKGENELTTEQRQKEETIEEAESYAGYENGPRTRLKMDKDNRPKISLWATLKSLVGKDMTRMTLPVTFNECTSLIQRSAEDMEYVDLLNKAASIVDDPGLRMAYIAAFSVSSYASTINRVAKPFNPLLGETYEYCRPDHKFRLVAEQVSHHPPISALYAESPKWDFYGDSNVKSKFNGRSFDINPLGMWYINMRPDTGAENKEELYSYRKVTSSVVGILVGNPVVDNYGIMEITNHSVGVKCTIDMKARGWRSTSAYKLEGKITDAKGEVVYTIGGFWNDKIFAKKAGSDEKILLWQVHDRPPAPFNLTPFAITLNGLDENLEAWLPPTDTQRRPDQRFMEEGQYDRAAEEKVRVEEKQRAARREREQSGKSHVPRWFEQVQHPVTKKSYYRPINGYWQLRKNHELGDKGDIF